MCCTLEPAKLSKTILYAGDATIDGQYRHVLGYQNRAENMFTGPNAMILPFPAEGRMGSENVIDTTTAKHVLTDLGEAFERRTRSMTKGFSRNDSDALLGSYVEVFDTGDYTVVLADDARDIPQVLHRVSENKRPRINNEVFEAYASWYPKWPIALCCWEAKKAVENQPLMWWYLPKLHHQLFMPGIDGHSGRAPNLKEAAERDHTLIVGTALATTQLLSQGTRVHYRDQGIIDASADLKNYLPTHVVGQKVAGMKPNADFYVRSAKAHEARFGFDHVSPPGA